MQAQIEILEVLVLTFPYSIVNVLHAAPVSLPTHIAACGSRPVPGPYSQPLLPMRTECVSSSGAVECTTRCLLFDCSMVRCHADNKIGLMYSGRNEVCHQIVAIRLREPV